MLTTVLLASVLAVGPETADDEFRAVVARMQSGDPKGAAEDWTKFLAEHGGHAREPLAVEPGVLLEPDRRSRGSGPPGRVGAGRLAE